MVSGGIIKDDLCKSNVGPCMVYNLRLWLYPVLYVICGKWIHSRCAGVNRVIEDLQEIVLVGNVKDIER